MVEKKLETSDDNAAVLLRSVVASLFLYTQTLTCSLNLYMLSNSAMLSASKSVHTGMTDTSELNVLLRVVFCIH